MQPTDLTCGRLMLRPWSTGDVDAVAAICQDPEIQRWTTVPSPYTREDARVFLTEIAPAGWEAGTMATWGVFDATTAEVLASVGLHGIGDGRAEIGYWCAPAARNQGVLSEAVAAVCRWGFGALGLEVIEWLAGVGNWPSRAVAEKSGFRVEGLRRLGMAQRGIRIDCWSASLLATDEVVDRRALPASPVLTDGIVTLRAWTVQDAEAQARGLDDPLCAKWLHRIVPYTLEHSLGFLTITVPGERADGRTAHFAVTQNAQLIGGVSLKLHDRALGVGEVDYWTAPWARGQGVAGRAARLVAAWGLEVLALDRVELLADVDNPRSLRVAEKAGFSREGIARQSRRDGDGTTRDMELLSVVRSDRAELRPI